MKALLSNLFHELIPALCLLCDEIVPAGTDTPGGPALTCPRHRFPTFDPQVPRCGSCARRLPAGFADELPCVECLKSRPRFDAVRCAADYHGPVREWILAFKHGGRRELAEYFALQLDARLPRGSAPPVCVPVPLHRWRHFARGYDQAQCLASSLAALRGGQCMRALRRVRATRPQGSALSLSREANVRAAFELRARAVDGIRGREIWLVDDVLTSGATANECARLLKQAGAARVEVVVVARA